VARDNKNGDEHVTDIEAAERVLAQLSDQKDRASEQVRKIAERRQVLACAVLARADKKAQDELTTLNQQLADLAVAIENIDCAVAEARRRLDVAQAAVARDVAAEHRAKARGIIKTLVEECAPELDETREHPDGTGPYHFSDPPTVARAGVLIGSLLMELRALKLDNGATFRFMHQEGRELCTKEDMRREMVRMLQAGWRYVPAAERRPLTPGRRQPSALPFVKMFGFWSQRLDGVLREQTNNTEVAA
jgi:hypothetical protein